MAVILSLGRRLTGISVLAESLVQKFCPGGVSASVQFVSSTFLQVHALFPFPVMKYIFGSNFFENHLCV